MRIEKAINEDAMILTDLTIRSKAHWDYTKEQIEEWREELTISEKYIKDNQIYKLIVNKLVVGFYAYNAENETDVKLNYLFVEPNDIGKGYGKHLIEDFLDRVKNLGYKRVSLDADPNAEKFYSKNGFRVIGKLQSSIKDRFLPIMGIELR